MTGYCAGQTGRDLAYGDTSERALPAMPCESAKFRGEPLKQSVSRGTLCP